MLESAKCSLPSIQVNGDAIAVQGKEKMEGNVRSRSNCFVTNSFAFLSIHHIYLLDLEFSDTSYEVGRTYYWLARKNRSIKGNYDCKKMEINYWWRKMNCRALGIK